MNKPTSVGMLRMFKVRNRFVKQGPQSYSDLLKNEKNCVTRLHVLGDVINPGQKYLEHSY